MVLVLANGLACHTMNFEVEQAKPGGVEKIHDRKAFFLGGLVPTRNVDAREHCPNGVQSIREETTFGDGLLSLITIGIYSPRSSDYYCKKGN
jgi:hypothetical protein